MSRKDSKGRVLRQGESERKDGRYTYRWTDAIGQRRSVYANTINELRKLEDEIAKNAFINVVYSNLTVNEAVEKYLDIVKKRLKAATWSNYKFYYEHSIKNSALGHMRVKDVRKAHIQEFYNFCKDKLGYANGTIAIFQKFLCPTFDWAIDNDLIIKNPTYGCLKDFPRVQEIKYALTTVQEQEFLQRLDFDKTGSFYKPALEVMLYTGLRISELVGLRWCDVDLQDRIIDVNHQVIYRSINGKGVLYSEDTTKTINGMRKIPMDDRVYDAFVRQRKIIDEMPCDKSVSVGKYTDFVFLSMCTHNVLNACQLRSLLRRVATKYNTCREVQLPAMSPHILRHTACTRMCEAGLDIKVIQYLMGHSDIRTTMKIYNHVNPERVQIGIQLLNESVKHRAAIFNQQVEQTVTEIDKCCV